MNDPDFIFSSAFELVDDFVRSKSSGRQIDNVNAVMAILSSCAFILEGEKDAAFVAKTFNNFADDYLKRQQHAV